MSGLSFGDSQLEAVESRTGYEASKDSEYDIDVEIEMGIETDVNVELDTVDSKELEHGCRLIYAGIPSFFVLGLEDGHVPTFWLLV